MRERIWCFFIFSFKFLFLAFFFYQTKVYSSLTVWKFQRFQNYIALWDFAVVEMETYLFLENWEQMWILQEYLLNLSWFEHVECWVLIVSCFLINACNVSSRFLLGGGSIRRCISLRILKIMVGLKWWLWSLSIIVTTLTTEIWMISPTRIVRLRVWVMIGHLETV